LIARLLADAAKETEHHKFSARFLLMEWEAIVDAWQIETWEAYRDVLRLGRKTKLPQKHQATLWSIFDRGRKELDARNLVTRAEMFTKLAAKITASAQPPFDFWRSIKPGHGGCAHLLLCRNRWQPSEWVVFCG
jgi:hypothetical protein